MNLSFAGCGFMGIYHVGVAACFRKYAPNLYLNRVSGASAGSLAAACLLCDTSLGEITNLILDVAMQARSRTLGPFSPSFNIGAMLKRGLEKNLPEDAHERVNGKINISVTRVCDGQNVVLTHFESKEELIQALLCSCFIPIFSGMLPLKFRGVHYIDGGLSDNLLVLDENTVTVSPFCGESDICPRDDTPRLMHVVIANTSFEVTKLNMYRLGRIMFPPKVETLSKICQQGFDDARLFLQHNNLVGCQRCISSMNLIVDKETSALQDCNDCQVQKRMVLVDRLPDAVTFMLQKAIRSTNSGVMNWIFRHKGLRLLSIMSLPCVIPVDVAYATFLKFVDTAPSVGSNLKDLAEGLIGYLINAASVVVGKEQLNDAGGSCQVAVAQVADDCALSELPTGRRQRTFSFSLGTDTDCPVMDHSETFISDDSIDEIATQAKLHEALMGYYFFDANNKPHLQNVVKETNHRAFFPNESI